jgi:hypothetical protein
MAWTSPMTFTDDTVLTASQLNTHLRDNLLETMPAKATQASTFFAVDATNHLVERNPGRDSNQTASNRNNTEYGDLNAGPNVSPTLIRTTGPTCLVMWRCQMAPTSATDRTGYCSIEIMRTNSEIGGVAGEDGTDDAVDGIEPADKYAICNQSATTNEYAGTAFMMFHNLLGEEEADPSEQRAFEYQFSLKYRSTGEISFNRKSLFVWPLS